MFTVDEFFNLLPDIKENNFYVWGTGNTAQLYQEGYRRENINIESYIDSDIVKQKRQFYGKIVISPESYREKRDLPVLINSVQKRVFGDISDQISKWGGWHQP